MGNIERIPFRDRISKVGYLVKHTFTVVGRDWDILTPVIRTVIYGVIQATVLTIGLAFVIHGAAADAAGLWAWGWALLVVGTALYLYKFFYNNYQEVRQSYLAYQTVKGEDHSYEQAVADSRQIRAEVRGMALLDMVMAYVRSARRQNTEGGIIGGLVSALLAGLGEVWDLANHYLIPAVVIDRVSLKEGASTIKRLKEQVPETLMGVFGIDIFGRVVGVLMAPIYLVMFLVAAWASFGLADSLPAVGVPAQGADLPGWMVEEGVLTLTLIPFFILIYLAKVFGVVLGRGVTAVKIMYFTIFYLQITHPERISDDLRDELTRYLRMEEDVDETEAGAPEPSWSPET